MKNKHKISTNLERTNKNTEIGVSFNNSRSLIPLQFTSRDQELRAHKILSTFKSPQVDQMQYQPSPQSKFHSYQITDVKMPTLFERYQMLNHPAKNEGSEEK